MNRRHLLIGSAASAAVSPLDAAPARGQAARMASPAQGTSPPSPDARDPGPLWRWDAVDLAAAIAARRISSREATASCLERIAAVNPKINAVVEVLADEALAAADLADRVVTAGGPLGRLHGVPITVKVNVDMRGHATTDGAVAFKDRIAAEDSAPVRNLRHDGAVIVGRTNTPALSFRYFTDNDLHGRTLNPWNPAVTPGGSSGGAAAAVAAGMGPLAHGNDIAGSVRYPAHACGVAGIRPTLGRVPAFNGGGSRRITSQLISAQGLLARRVRDLRLGLPSLARRDVRDAWWVPAPWTFEGPNRPLRVALLRRQDGVVAAPSVVQALNRAATALERAGYVVEEAAPPHLAEAAELWSLLVMNEIRATALPGIRANGDAKVNNEVAAWLEITPPLDLAGFSRALGRREQILRDWIAFVQTYPVVVTPASWKAPFPIDLDQGGPSAMRDILAAQGPLLAVAVAGLPSLGVPTGVVDGLPTGVQVAADRFREDLCFEVGEAIERAADMGTPIDPRS